ncbi:MAG: hypothetical protein GYA33_11895 [Thermogutta sp.]|nr:hypothetical protein [Thermogutta sp.]
MAAPEKPLWRYLFRMPDDDWRVRKHAATYWGGIIMSDDDLWRMLLHKLPKTFTIEGKVDEKTLAAYGPADWRPGRDFPPFRVTMEPPDDPPHHAIPRRWMRTDSPKRTY